MSRKPRLTSSTGIYHVMLRGVNRKTIFCDEMDRKKFIKVLHCVKEQSGFHLYSYCLMDNHVHLLIEEKKESLAVIMKRIGVSYAYYFNHKYQCIGHLFQDRFRSETVETDAYFYSLVRYICQNPVVKGLVRHPTEYPWLGCSGLTNDDLLDRTELLAHLTTDELKSFICETPEWDHIDDLESETMTDEELREQICMICACKDTLEIAEYGPKKRNAQIKKMLEAGIPVLRISELTGISKSTVDRVRRG